jgi:hypothetical protein
MPNQLDYIDREQLIKDAKCARMKFVSQNFTSFVYGSGLLGLLCTFGITVLTANRYQEANRQFERALDATVQMEEFVEMLTHANKISSNSTREIAQLMRHPQYNCDLVACDAALERRNHIVRSELNALLASATRPDEAQISHAAKTTSTPLGAVH